MTQRFKDQVVVITGATSGIGLETAKCFAAEGAVVIGAGRDKARLDALRSVVTTTVSLDVTDDESVTKASQEILERFGHVDVLINNAGIGLFEPWDKTPASEVHRLMDTNLYGVIRVTRAILPAMVERNSGVVVNIASVAGKRAYANHTAYCATKHALIGYSEGLRCDLKESDVDVVVVLPPAVRTPFFENSGYFTFDEDHVGLKIMGPEAVAEGVLDATADRSRQKILSARAKVLYGLSLVSPDFVDFIRRFK